MKHHTKLLLLDVDGTLTDGGVYIMENGQQFKKFNAKDGLGIKMAIKAGIEVGIISHSHATEMVNTRAGDLGMKYIYVGQEPKTQVLERWIAEMGIDTMEVAFVGDDLNDLDIMQAVGLSACPADASEKVKDVATYCMQRKGGEGCVREFIDRYLLK